MIPAHALDIIIADYAAGDRTESHERHDALAVDGLHAGLWRDRDGSLGVVIRGSDSRMNWVRNFQFIPGFTAPGDSGALYHRGMIGDARIVWAWAKGKGIRWVIGHSRGGGVAQIVGPSLDVPTLTFGAPMVLASRVMPPGAYHAVNFVLRCDPVGRVVPGYRHVGRRVRQRCKGWGFAHSAKAYRAMGWG